MAVEAPFVSVIIPVYNAETYLPECIACLKAQTLKAFEVIFIDDGSTDGSLKLLKNISDSEDRFQVINGNHQNAGAARNKGIQKARGRYLSFLDVDDSFEPQLLERASSLLEKTGADIAVYHFKENSTDGTVSSRILFETEGNDPYKFAPDPAKNPERALLFGGASVWNKMYRAEMVLKNQLHFDETDAYNDVAFVLLANLRAKKIACLDEWLYTYHCNRPGSISDQKKSRYSLIWDVMKNLSQQAEGLDPAVIDIARAHFLIKTLIMDVGDYRSRHTEEYYRALRKYLKETRFDKTMISNTYPQLNGLIWGVKCLDIRSIRFLYTLGITKLIRKRIHKRRERRNEQR